MAEAQVSVDGTTRMLPSPFVVIATDNPIEYEGTYTLPEAQLDRFLLRVRMGYLPVADEAAMLRARLDRSAPEAVLKPLTDPAEVLAMRDSLERVEIDDDLVDYIVALIDATRKHAQIQVGASPRGGLALVQLARARAVMSGRDFVTPEDVKSVAVPALAHRISLKPELWVRRISADDVIAAVAETVPTPRTTPRKA
jgi:MoxR-like ATPase